MTVGYQGRYFETRNKPKGGAFADDGFTQTPLAFEVGDGTVRAARRSKTYPLNGLKCTINIGSLI